MSKNLSKFSTVKIFGIVIFVFFWLILFFGHRGQADLDAIKKGDIGELRSLIAQGWDLNKRFELGNTGIMLAVEYEHKGVFELLARKGADIHLKNELGYNALSIATLKNRKDMVILCLDNWADPEILDVLSKENQTNLDVEMILYKWKQEQKDKGNTPLIVATARGNLSEVKKLSLDKKEVNKLNNKRETPIFYAAKFGRTKIAEVLLNAGAEIWRRNSAGESVWEIALNGHHANIIKLFERAKINRYKENNSSELINSVKSENLKDVRYLLESGVDVNSLNVNDWTPLMFAEKIEIVRLLLVFRANVNARADNNYTALHSAGYSGNIKKAEILLENGADLNAIMEGGLSVLMAAVYGGHSDLVRLFIEKGLDVNAKTSSGQTVLMLAKSLGNQRITKLLLEYGAI